MYYFLNLTKRTVCILLCVALLLAYAIPSFAENGDEDIQESGGEPSAAEVADGEYSADGESAQSGEADITEENTAQDASESGNDGSDNEANSAESTESEDDENSSVSDEESASEDSAENAESITFSALEANESGEATEVNEEENQTEVEEAVYAESITLSETSAELLVGSELELEAVITPDDATAEVIWLSGNEDVASVVSGKVTALSTGTATITATVDGLEAVCEVTVYEETDVAFVWTDEITTIVSVRKGTTAEALSIADMPDDEKLDEYRTGEFDIAWYIDGDLTEKFDFTTEITEPVTLYAKFLETLSVEYVWSDSQATVSTIFADSCADSLELGDAPEDVQALYDVRYQVIWYSDELLTETYDFESSVTENLTLYADYDFLPEMEWFADTTKSSYTLVTAAELQSLAVLTTAGYTFAGVTIYLGEDESEGNTESGTLDLSGIEWEPIGTAEHPFAGTFDGGIYGEVDGETGLTGIFTLSGLSLGSYKEFDYAGLFGYVTGDIRNVTVSGTVYVTAQYAGGIVGWLEGTITNCTNQTMVQNKLADGITGGVVGYVNGAVYNCANEGTLVYNQSAGNGMIGGIVGLASGYVTDSINAGRYVMGNADSCGGIVGEIESGSILRCINNGTRVQNSSDSGVSGGIVGFCQADVLIQYCGNTSSVMANTAAGGVVGKITDSTVFSSFNSGTISYYSDKTASLGKIVGYSEAQYEDIVLLCVDMTSQNGSFVDADAVTSAGDPSEAAYILDNGGNEERYGVWGWSTDDETPILVSRGANPVYKLSVTALQSIVEPLPSSYYPVGDTVTMYAAKDVQVGDEWIVIGLDMDECIVSDDGSSLSFVMPAEDVAISVTVANQDEEYTVTFYGYVDFESQYTTYDTQSVYGGECVVAPEEKDGAADINAYYPYYEDEVFRGYYVFMGWYLMDEDGALSEEYDFDWMVGTDLELYAEWSLVTVQFSFNGVTATTTLPSSYKIGIGTTLEWPSPEPETSESQTYFLGWSTQKRLSISELDTQVWQFVNADDETENESDSGEAWVLSLDNTENLTLQFYAVWSNSIYAWAKAYDVQGNGTEEEPFEISTNDQLNHMAEMMTEEQGLEGYYFKLMDTDNDIAGHFTLTNSIVPYHSYEYSSSEDDYVHVYGEYFNGVFDGNDCEIDITDSQIGLFGVIGESGEVRNLKLTGDVTKIYDSTSSYYFATTTTDSSTGNNTHSTVRGAVAAYSYGLIEDCEYSDGEVSYNSTYSTSTGTAGGIVGVLFDGAIIKDCTISNVKIFGTIAGGVAGYISGGGEVEDCTVENSSTIWGWRYAGGIAGKSYVANLGFSVETEIGVKISGCHVGSKSETDETIVKIPYDEAEFADRYTSEFSGYGGEWIAGGIVGRAGGTEISDCDNYATVYGVFSIGGIGGSLVGCKLTGCTNNGTVSGNNSSVVGGIVGRLDSGYLVQNCKFNGEITVFSNSSIPSDSITAGAIGGIVGSIQSGGTSTLDDSVFSLSISECENNGKINISANTLGSAGGLVGNAPQNQVSEEALKISNSVMSGEITVTAAETAKNIGGLVGGSITMDGSGAQEYGCVFDNVTVKGTIITVTAKDCSNISLLMSKSSYCGGESSIKIEKSEINVYSEESSEYIGGVFTYADLENGAQIDWVSWDEVSVYAEVGGEANYIGGYAASVSLTDDPDDSQIILDELSLSNISIEVYGNASYLGGFAGLLLGSGELSVSCDNIDIAVNGNGNNVGGILGYLSLDSVLTKSRFTEGSVSVDVSDYDVGGLCGFGNIINSYFCGEFNSSGDGVGLLTGGGDTDGVKSSFFYNTGSSNASSIGISGDGTSCVTGSYYYLDDYDDGFESKTKEQFKSGYVAWLMEIGGDEEDIGDHAFVWKQGSKYPEWSDGDATVYRVGVADDLEHVEISLSDSKECVYLNDDDDEGVEVMVTVSEDTYSVTEDDEEVEYGYVLQSFSHISEPDEATTTLKTYSAEDNITVLTYNYTPASDGKLSAAVTTVLMEVEEIIPPVAEEEGEGDGDGSGDDDSEGSGGSGGGDGTGYGGTDATTAGTSVPTIGADEEGPTIISDTSPDVQIEETLGEEAPAGGTEAEETVEAPETETEVDSEIEPEPEPEPEPEAEAEPEVHTYQLITNIVETIKDNPLIAALAAVGAIIICVGGGAYQYRKHKKDYD